MLSLIGIGLWDAEDISLKGLDIVKKADKIYFESYTSKLGCSIKKLERVYGRKVLVADRNLVEDGKEILKEAEKNDVVLLIMGDVFGATTHMDLFLRAKKKKIRTAIVNNASVLTAVGITGLSLYNFGKIISIPFDNKGIKSSYNKFLENKKNGLHSLFLLDLRVKEKNLMSIKEGLNYLIRNGLSKTNLCVGCAGLGSKKPEIKFGKVKDLLKFKFKKLPQCLIVPGKLQFYEEEALEFWK